MNHAEPPFFNAEAAALFRAAHDAIIIFDPESERVLEVNARACAIYGYSRSEFLGLTLKTMSQDVSRGEAKIQETLQTHGHLSFETVQYHRDGRALHIEVNASLWRYGGRSSILSINRDVSERRALETQLRGLNEALEARVAARTAELEAQNARLRQEVAERERIEAELRASERRFQDVAEVTGEYLWECDSNGRYTFLTERVRSVLGYAPERLVGHTPFAFMPPDERARLEPWFSILVARGEAFKNLEHRSLCPDGKVIWQLVSGVPIFGEAGQLVGYRGAARNISDRKADEAQLHLLESAVVHANDGLIITDAETLEPPGPRILYVNPAFERMTGYRAEEVIGHNPRLLQGELSSGAERERMRRHLAQGLPVRAELLNYRKDGSTFWVEMDITPIVDSAGTPTHFIAVQRDVSARKGAEAEILRLNVQLSELLNERGTLLARLSDRLEEETTDHQRTEAQFQAVWNLAADALLLSDPQGRVVAVNPAFCTLYACQAEEVTGEHFALVFPPERRDDARKAYHNVFMSPTPLETYEAEIHTRDGKIRTIESRVTFITEEGERRAMLSMLRDISRRKATEMSLREALEEKEVLLREIHHRVKNNMQVISSLLSMQANYLPDEASAALLEAAEARIQAMALVHEHLYGSRNLARVSFALYLRSLSESLLGAYGAMRVRLRLEVAPVELDIDSAITCGLIINEALLNALKHAFVGLHAQPEITLRFQETATGYELELRDNGVGLPAPFETLRGQSLGLKLIEIFTRQLKGQLSISSADGSRVHIRFPRVKA